MGARGRRGVFPGVGARCPYSTPRLFVSFCLGRPYVQGTKKGLGVSTQTPTGSVAAAISTAAVRLLAEYTGRGPTKAKRTISRDLVVVLLADTLTKAERTLVSKDGEDLVLELRHRFQVAMRDDLVAAVESATERKVIAFMSDSQLEPDYSVEVFVLAPEHSKAPDARTAA
jgi:uncharacterized protein YbcI